MSAAGGHRFLSLRRIIFWREAFVLRALVLLTISGLATFGNSSDSEATGGPGSAAVVDSSSSSGTQLTGLSPGGSYRFVVTGTFTYSTPAGTKTADAECADGLRLGDATNPTDDFYDLYVDGANQEWRALSPGVLDPLNRCAIDSAHTYVLDYTPPSSTVTFHVKDSGYADNSGSLYVWVACYTPWPTGPLFIQQAATNQASNETATVTSSCPNGSVPTASSFRQVQNLDYPLADNYQCPKIVRKGPADDGHSFGVIQTATVLMDSRDNVDDPVNPGEEFWSYRAYPTPASGYYATSPASYYKQAGHWGIRTCNWTTAGATYRIVVKGTYKYDQSTPDGYGEADAECATGYQESTSTVRDWTGATTTATWSDEYLPIHYTYELDKMEDNVASTTRPYAANSGGIFDRYGSEWRDHRFDFRPTDQQTLPTVTVDSFDLEFGVQGEAQFVTWTALEMVGGALGSTTSVCSSIHTYATDYVAKGGPIHFALWDLVRYNEWDDCGVLSVLVTTSTSTYSAPPDPPSADCHYVPTPWSTKVLMKDAEEGVQVFYFDPPKTVVKQSRFLVDNPSGGVTNTTIYWQNDNGVHTVTAGVDKNGLPCGRPSLPTDTASPGLGRDDCDLATSTARAFSFDEQEIAVAGGVVSWKLFDNVNASFDDNVCNGTYCSIPYFCRYKPDLMRGHIIVKQD